MAEEDFLKEIDDQENPDLETDEDLFEGPEEEEPDDYFIDDDEEL